MNRVMFNMNRVSHRVVISVVLVIFCEITGLESGSTVGAVNLPPVFWNSSNPVFRTDNTDHVIDVQIGDRVNIMCPHYPRDFPKELAETHIIYQVTKEEYVSCRIPQRNISHKITRQILTCDKPEGHNFYTITFREFTPIPMGLEFKRGMDYYYISTSSGKPKGLKNLSGGSCRENNMRLIFKVCCNSELSTGAEEEESVDEQTPTHRVRHRHNQREGEDTPNSSHDEKSVTQPSSIRGRVTSLPAESTTRKKYHEVEIRENEVSPEAGAYFNTASSLHTLPTIANVVVVAGLLSFCARMLHLSS